MAKNLRARIAQTMYEAHVWASLWHQLQASRWTLRWLAIRTEKHMDGSQPWYASRAVWGSLVAIVASGVAILSHNQVQIIPADQDQIVTLVVTGVGAIGGLVALYGRIRASKQIAPTPPKGN